MEPCKNFTVLDCQYRKTFLYDPPADWLLHIEMKLASKILEQLPCIPDYSSFFTSSSSSSSKIGKKKPDEFAFYSLLKAAQLCLFKVPEDGYLIVPALQMCIPFMRVFSCQYCNRNEQGDGIQLVTCHTCTTYACKDCFFAKHNADECRWWLSVKRAVTPFLSNCSICANCMRIKKKMKRCGTCKKAYYCSVACQCLDWLNRHESECSSL